MEISRRIEAYLSGALATIVCIQIQVSQVTFIHSLGALVNVMDGCASNHLCFNLLVAYQVRSMQCLIENRKSLADQDN